MITTSTTISNALVSSGFSFVVFITMGSYRFCTGQAIRVLKTETFTPGVLLELGAIKHTGDRTDKASFQFTLDFSTNFALYSYFLTNDSLGIPVQVEVVPLDSDNVLVDTTSSIVLFKGATVEYSGEITTRTKEVTIFCEEQ